MKICLLNHSFPPQIGGGETYLYNLANGFADRGHEVLVISGGPILKFKKIENKFEIVRIKYFQDFENGKSSFRFILDDLADAITIKKFDIVHVHNFMPALAYAFLAPIIKTKKTVFTFHSTPIPEDGKIIGHFAKYNVEKSFITSILKIPFYNVLVCPSKYYYNWALKLGADKNQIKLVYHGIEEKHFSVKKNAKWRKMYNYSEEDFIILCPARMIYRKGILDLIKAMKIMNDEKIKLFIPTSIKNGSIEYLTAINNYIINNRLTDRIKIVVDKENINTMPQVFANCNVCVLPSYIEGFGLVLLEGMAAGIPVIGSNTFGINEVIKDGVNGLLFRRKDPKNIAEKILIIKKNRSLSNMLIHEGKNSIRSKYSLTKHIESLELIYKL